MKKLFLSIAVSGILAFASDRALISDDYSNYFSTAKEIPLNTTINGELETINDIDIFKFSIKEDDGIKFTVKGFEYFVDIYIIKKSTIEILSEYLSESTWDIKTDVQSNIKHIVNLGSSNNTENETTLNINSGDYYVVVFTYSDDLTSSYTFKIESELNEGNVTLDKVTLEYCKNNPSECGISVNSELKYTQSDLDSAVSSARTDERNQLKLSKEKIESLGNGWNMVGTGEAISTSELNGEIWSYENGSWNHNPNELKAFSGFWIKK